MWIGCQRASHRAQPAALRAGRAAPTAPIRHGAAGKTRQGRILNGCPLRESIEAMLKGQAALMRLARRELPAAIADRWIGLLRPSYLLRAADDDEMIVGQLGGVPVLPDGMAWPQHPDGRGPLTFIAEIDCGQLPSYTLSMPRTGTLSFFAWDEETVGYLEAARVVYTPPSTPVTERDPPPDARI
jgi:hypothetical protein